LHNVKTKTEKNGDSRLKYEHVFMYSFIEPMY